MYSIVHLHVLQSVLRQAFLEDIYDKEFNTDAEFQIAVSKFERDYLQKCNGPEQVR